MPHDGLQQIIFLHAKEQPDMNTCLPYTLLTFPLTEYVHPAESKRSLEPLQLLVSISLALRKSKKHGDTSRSGAESGDGHSAISGGPSGASIGVRSGTSIGAGYSGAYSD